MFLFLTILIVLSSILMIFLVVIQKSKGGGLAAGFSSSNQVLGVRKTTDFLDKATWTLAAVIFVLCVVVAAFSPTRQVVSGSEIEKKVQQTELPQALPDFSGTSTEQGTDQAPIKPVEQPNNQ